jgi:hypothetical protein
MLLFWVPAITHLYVLTAGLIAGQILNPPFLLLVGLVITAIAFYLYYSTIQHILASKQSVRAQLLMLV